MSRFDKEATSWDKNVRRQLLAKSVAKDIKSSIPDKTYSILDIGCGTGLLSYNLTDIAKKIVGYDTSKRMVEEFNKKSSSPNIYATTTLPNEQFDLIVSSMTLHHIRSLKDFLALTAHLENGGYLCIADLVTEDGTFHDRGNDGVFHFGFDPDELANFFEKAGFKKICHTTPFTIQKAKPYPIFLLCFVKMSAAS